MNHHEEPLRGRAVHENNKEGSYVAYTVGLILSVMGTLLAYVVVSGKLFSAAATTTIVAVLAVLQLIAQLVFFLHLGRGREARWKSVAFVFMLIILVIVIGGSLWIMYNLNYHMMTPQDMNTYMLKQSKAGF